MKITLLVLQRKGRYAGEYAPEVLSVVDETTLDDNPEWWPGEVAKQKAAVGDDAEAWAEVDVVLDGAAIERALYPLREVVLGRVDEEPA